MTSILLTLVFVAQQKAGFSERIRRSHILAYSDKSFDECNLNQARDSIKALRANKAGGSALQQTLATCNTSVEKDALLTEVLSLPSEERTIRRKEHLQWIEEKEIVAAFFGQRFPLLDVEYCWLTKNEGLRNLISTVILLRFHVRRASPRLWQVLAPSGKFQRQCFVDFMKPFTCTQQFSILQHAGYVTEASHILEMIAPCWTRSIQQNDNVDKTLEDANVMLLQLPPSVRTTLEPDIMRHVIGNSSLLVDLLSQWKGETHNAQYVSTLIHALCPSVTEARVYDLALNRIHEWACTTFSSCKSGESTWIKKMMKLNGGKSVSLEKCSVSQEFDKQASDCRYLFRGFLAQVRVLKNFIASGWNEDQRGEYAEMIEFFAVSLLEKPRKAADKLITARLLTEGLQEYPVIRSEAGSTRRGKQFQSMISWLGTDSVTSVRLPDFINMAGLLPLKPLLPILLPFMLAPADRDIEAASDSEAGVTAFQRLEYLANYLGKNTISALRHLLVLFRQVFGLDSLTIHELLTTLPAPRTQIRLTSLLALSPCVRLDLNQKTRTVSVQDVSTCGGQDTLLQKADVLVAASVADSELTKKQLKKITDPIDIIKDLRTIKGNMLGAVSLRFARKTNTPRLDVTSWAQKMETFAWVYFDMNCVEEDLSSARHNRGGCGARAAMDKMFSKDKDTSVETAEQAALFAKGDWIQRDFVAAFRSDDGSTNALKCVFSKFRRPELMLSYLKSHAEDRSIVDDFRKWVTAVGQDCLSSRPSPGHGAVDELRFHDPRNSVHITAIPAETFNAWRYTSLLERSPETLFHIGQAVGSCQGITGSFVSSYNGGLVSYLTVGHFGVLTDTVGDDACAEMPDEATCTLLRGRAVVRLLLSQNNDHALDKVALLLEEPYANTRQISGSEQEKALYDRLLKKARRLSGEVGVPLFQVSREKSKYGPCIDETSIVLHSLGGAAPYTYVDSLSTLLDSTAFHVTANCRLN